MSYYHWLIKKLICQPGRKESGGKSTDSGRKRRDWEMTAAAREARSGVTSHSPVVKYKLTEMG